VSNQRQQLVYAAVVGVLLALISVTFGLLAMAIAIAAVMGLGYVAGVGWLSGGLIGLGGTWFLLFANAAIQCAGPGQPCGATPLDSTPHIVVSLGLAIAGSAIFLRAAVRESGRRSARQPHEMSGDR
jgi:hypothetical protein